MSHYTSNLLYVYDRLTYIYIYIYILHFITRRMNCVNFKWFSNFFGSHGEKLVKNYDRICITKMATSSINIIRIFRNGDLGLIPAAFGKYLYLVRPSPHRSR